MWRYVARRIVAMIPLLIGVTAISFFIINLAPGDFLTQLALNPTVSSELLDSMRQQFGLDRPWYIQYFRWLWGLFRLDFGYSFAYHVPVFDLIVPRVGATILMSVCSAVFAWALAIPIGIHSAIRRHSITDKIFTTFSFIGLAIPNFFLALILLFLIARYGIPLPIGGLTSLGFEWMSPWEKTVDLARHLVVPTIVLGTASMATLMRLMRGNLLEVMQLDFIRTAYAKGLPGRTVIYKHGVRNAINPLITIFGYEIANLLSGAALTEAVLGYPGLGQLTLQAVLTIDLYLVMASLVVSGVLLVVGNLVADILLAIADPRIRYD